MTTSTMRTVHFRSAAFPAVVAMIGGGALITGAMLPWMTFYAGLSSVTGTRGAYGKAILVAGLVVCLVGVIRLRRESPFAQRALTTLGIITSLAGGLLLWRAIRLTQSQEALMLIPQLGPGLAVVIAGGVTALWAGLWRGAQARSASPSAAVRPHATAS